MGEKVHLAGQAVNRLGLSVAGLRSTGMWGEPVGREAAVAVIRRAVELGAEVIEVPVPFGPAADLVREARLPAEVLIAARLTGPTTLDVLTGRLGRKPDLVLAGRESLDELRDWTVALGLISDGGGPEPGVAAIRGPHPAPHGVIEWCETHAVPYMATETGVLAAGDHTIALPGPRSVSEVERLFGDEPATPPAGGPE